jgi:hypothetical protein
MQLASTGEQVLTGGHHGRWDLVTKSIAARVAHPRGLFAQHLSMAAIAGIERGSVEAKKPARPEMAFAPHEPLEPELRT